LFKPGARETGAKTVKGSEAGSQERRDRKTGGKGLEKKPGCPPTTAKHSGAAASQKKPKTGRQGEPIRKRKRHEQGPLGDRSEAYSSIKWMRSKPASDGHTPLHRRCEKLRRDKKETVRIDLVDGQGAAILTLTIPFDDMKPVRDDKNKITALEYGKTSPL